MSILQRIANPQPAFSFEFFPPKTQEGEKNLFRTVESLRALDPAFVSVTCGAGGSTRRKTVAWAGKIQNELHLPAVVHMTCLGMPETELQTTIDELQSHQLTNILALRGDPPKDTELPPSACHFANELVQKLRQSIPQATIAAACYPETHNEAPSRLADLESLKRKADAGTDFFITQLFFDNSKYFEFVGRARSLGLTQPIVPGIMPIHNVEQTKRFTTMCGATIPISLLRLLEQYESSPSAVFHIGVAHAIAQAHDLLANGAPGVHFYTLNRSPATRLVVQALQKDLALKAP